MSAFACKSSSGRIDWVAVWKAERDRIDLAAVATRLLGPPPGRRGEGGRMLWWCCPFHDDRNPSFKIDPGSPWWKCWGCSEHGDAAGLLMRLTGATFPEAVAELTGRDSLPSLLRRPTPAPSRAAASPRPEPSGLPSEEAERVAIDAVATLWGGRGRSARDYLRGRGLEDETIQAAGLGLADRLAVPTRSGGTFRATGVVIPWRVAGRLAMLKIRQRPGATPKYVEAFRDPVLMTDATFSITPRRPRWPVVIVEGEFDAILLGQEIGRSLADVLTLGSAANGPTRAILDESASAGAWYVAHDADPAGDKAAAGWPSRAKRIKPPEPHKDWTDAYLAGVNLWRYWAGIILASDDPEPSTDGPLDDWRWGPCLDGSWGPDDYAEQERLAIREADGIVS